MHSFNKFIKRGITLSLFLSFLSQVLISQNCYVAVNTVESVNSSVNNVRHIGFQIEECDKIDSIIYIFDTTNFDDEVEYFVEELINAKLFNKPYRAVVSNDIYMKMNPHQGLSTYSITNTISSLGSDANPNFICKLDLLDCTSEPQLDSLILDRKSVKLSELNSMFPYFKSDSLFLLISDIENSINLINSNQGKSVGKFNANSLNGYDLFCKHFAKNDKECQLAKKGEANLKKIGRNRVPVYKLKTRNGKIYAGCGLQVLIELKEDFKYLDDRMEGKVYPKGSPFYWQFSVILEFDASLNLLNTYGVDETTLPENLKGQYLAGIDFGFDFVNDSLLVTYSTPNARYDISTSDPALSFYRFEKDRLIFKSGSKKSFPPNFDKREYWCYNSYIISHNKGVIFNLPAYNSFSITDSKDMTTLGNYKIDKNYNSNGTNTFSKFVQDSTLTSIDFFVLDMFSDGNDISFLYRVKDQLFFRQNNKLQNLSKFPDFPKIDFKEFDEGNCTITDTQILFILKQRNGYVLYKFIYK